MTNEQAKQEAIKKAFGKFFNPDNERYLRATNINGWMNKSYYPIELESEIGFNGKIMRPIQLKGIEDNNGWIRIEPDGSNLPADDFKISFKCLYKDGGFENVNANKIRRDFNFQYHLITHYKPITPEPKPVY